MKIRLGVIGAGRWGPNLIRNFHTRPQCQVVAIAEKLETRCQLIKERYPDLQVTASADEILASPEIDAVIISTPTVTHHELTKKALQKKKHVFVEKPLASTSRECRELVELAEKVNRVLFVGHVFVYNAGIQAVKQFLDSGELGKIYYIHMTRTNLGPIRQDVNALWDLAPHDLSILQYWMGKKPSEVSATHGIFLNQNLADVVFATYKFPHNVIAHLHVSWLNPKKVREIIVVGENKMLVWDDMDINNPIRIYDKKVVYDKSQETLVDTFVGFRASIHEGEVVIPKIQVNEPLATECMAFLKAIENPKNSLSQGHHGAEVVEVLEATDRSLKEGGRAIPI